jgi:uncharacterized cupredoxin-like copper-binding protein
VPASITRRFSIPALLACSLGAAALLAGCGQTSSAAPVEGPLFEVGGTDTMRFEPETITIKAGQAVTIVFRNRGFIVHDYISTGAEQNAKLANVQGGREARGVFKAAKPGTYQVLCLQPGHKEAGMVGKIVVTE